MYTVAFWKAAGERALGLFAGSLVTTVTVDGDGMSWADWEGGLSVALGVALVSVLCSVGKSHVGTEGPGLFETTRGVGRSGDS
jgi:Putative lactococcus lactis phage r1t holin